MIVNPRVISVSSGKGGVGKTTLVSNLGTLWAQKGKRVLLIDGDWNLGKLGITLGVKPQWTVDKALGGEVPFDKVIHSINENLSLLASPSGVLGFEELTGDQRNQLFFEIERCCGIYDLILIDHSSGLDWNVLQFAAAAHQHVVVLTTEPTSYMDAYAIMKILSKRFGVREFWLVVTMSQNDSETSGVMNRFSDYVREQLMVRVNLLETLPWDPQLGEAIRRQQPYVLQHPHSALTSRFERLCRRIENSPVKETSGLRFFYSQQLASTR